MPRRPRRPLRKHPRLAGQVDQRQLVAVGQRVAVWQHRRDRFAQDDLAGQVVHERRSAQAGVERALAQARDEVGDPHVLGVELDPRHALGERRTTGGMR
jgi:hypothetical protein